MRTIGGKTRQSHLSAVPSMNDSATGLAQTFQVAGQGPAGPGSSAIKYDVLTAILTLAAQGEPTRARLALRLSLLITARYNWRRGTFAVAQKELARMWGVTERTAKREVAQMRHLGWIILAVPSARGRVAEHRIDLTKLMHETRALWSKVGPDFETRMSGVPETQGQGGGATVVPIRQTAAVSSDAPEGWAAAMETLHAQDASIFGAWFAHLEPICVEDGVLHLQARTRFVADYITTHLIQRLRHAALCANRDLVDVKVTGPV